MVGIQNEVSKQLCFKLARLGFNFILFDANLQELDDLKVQIQKLNNKIMVKTMKYNFENGINPDYYKEISDSVKNINFIIL